MVYTEFSFKCAKSCLIFTFLACAFFSHADASQSELDPFTQAEITLPIFAAQLSEALQQECEVRACDVNPLSSDKLQSIFQEHPLHDEVSAAFAISDYELLISSAKVPSALGHQELILEMTTSWRGIPVDDFSIKGALKQSVFEIAALQIDQWVEHAIVNDIFDAQRIYSQIGASDYLSNMRLPEKIGDFVFIETALYHDPMMGSISRYVHPEYSDAIVDVSVYPVSPFVHAYEDTRLPINAEMELEKSSIQKLIAQANIEDYQISEIKSMRVDSIMGEIDALSMEVALHATFDPVYSTQLLFTQNDKFIKVTGTLPKDMMLALVQDSIKTIAVPEESQFMQAMRQP